MDHSPRERRRSARRGRDRSSTGHRERIPQRGSFPNVMATRFEDQPWHQEWREALDRVIAAQMRRDSAKLGTPEREAANREHEAALVVFRALAEKIRPRSS